jgi:hypothetical protein
VPIRSSELGYEKPNAPLLASVDPDARALEKKLENAERVEPVSKRDRLLE